MDPQLKAQLGQTIYTSAAGAVATAAGQPASYGSPASHAARVEATTKRSRGPDGEELITDWRVITEDAILQTDLLWLPGVDQANRGLARQVERVVVCVDELGAVDHYESFC